MPTDRITAKELARAALHPVLFQLDRFLDTGETHHPILPVEIFPRGYQEIVWLAELTRRAERFLDGALGDLPGAVVPPECWSIVHFLRMAASALARIGAPPHREAEEEGHLSTLVALKLEGRRALRDLQAVERPEGAGWVQGDEEEDRPLPDVARERSPLYGCDDHPIGPFIHAPPALSH